MLPTHVPNEKICRNRRVAATKESFSTDPDYHSLLESFVESDRSNTDGPTYFAD
jgi:hypothetical protein